MDVCNTVLLLLASLASHVETKTELLWAVDYDPYVRSRVDRLRHS